MLELPEIATVAKQMADEMTGAEIASCTQGNSPHKFVWYSDGPQTYERAMVGKRLGAARAEANTISLPIEPGLQLRIGDLGGRVLLLHPGAKLPNKRHLTLSLADGRTFVVAIQGWGGLWLTDEGEAAPYEDFSRVDPLSDELTHERFKALVAEDAAQQKRRSVKAFLASRPRLAGIGNGYTQDICYRARLHPKREVRDLSGRDIQRWYRSIRGTLQEAVDKGGRDTERDLHGMPGRYVPVMDRRALGRPCPECGAAVERISYLGGSCYLCEVCQPPP